MRIAPAFTGVAGLLAIVLWVATPAPAQSPRSTLASTQYGGVADFTSVPDGAGGIVVAWADSRYGGRNIYAQRLSAVGARLWPDTGVAVCAAAGDQLYPTVAADGTGGAIVAWRDERSGEARVYARRVDGSGTPRWATDGVPLCTATGAEWGPVTLGDGTGGAIVAWSDNRAGPVDVYAQRVDGAGALLWSTAGMPLCTAVGHQFQADILADGAGGTIVPLTDGRRGADSDIYAQRLDAAGAPLWSADGVGLGTSSDWQEFPSSATDGAGGAIVAWHEYDIPEFGHFKIFVQRVNAAGTPQWTAGGVLLCPAAGSTQVFPVAVTDGAGGAIVLFSDYRPAVLYARRVNAAGTPLWDSDGVVLCAASGSRSRASLIPDGGGGAYAAWEETRGGSGNADIYAQRMSGDGAVLWAAAAVPLCTAASRQVNPVLAPDGAGGAIAVWKDFRAWPGADSALYAQRVGGSGTIHWPSDGVPVAFTPWALVSAHPRPAPFALAGARPNPARGNLEVWFSLPDAGEGTIELLDVSGRRLETFTLAGLGSGSHALRFGDRAPLHPGIYLVRLTRGGQALARTACLLK